MFSLNRFCATTTALVVFASAVSLSAQEPPALNPSLRPVDGVLARLKARLDVDPIECGRHPIPERATPPDNYAHALTTSVRCVTDAAAQRRPSWMLVQQRGIDSWVATGLVSDAAGVVRQFNYDGDPSGGGGAPPTLSIRPCATPMVTRRNGDVRLECSPPTDVR